MFQSIEAAINYISPRQVRTKKKKKRNYYFIHTVIIDNLQLFITFWKYFWLYLIEEFHLIHVQTEDNRLIVPKKIDKI